MKQSPLTLLGISGSLRKGSYNTHLLELCQKHAPKDCVIEITTLHEIPLYNQDLEKDMPPSVQDFKTKILAADGILIATPEYNYSIPGVLKNAIDWASRPYGESAWKKKPVAIMGTSPSVLGTARCQYHLRQTFITLNMIPMNLPELMIGEVHKYCDSEGNLSDEAIKQRVMQFLQAFIDWVKQH